MKNKFSFFLKQYSWINWNKNITKNIVNYFLNSYTLNKNNKPKYLYRGEVRKLEENNFLWKGLVSFTEDIEVAFRFASKFHMNFKNKNYIYIPPKKQFVVFRLEFDKFYNNILFDYNHTDIIFKGEKEYWLFFKQNLELPLYCFYKNNTEKVICINKKYLFYNY